MGRPRKRDDVAVVQPARKTFDFAERPPAPPPADVRCQYSRCRKVFAPVRAHQRFCTDKCRILEFKVAHGLTRGGRVPTPRKRVS